jgi:hypothetical protein
MREGSTSCRLYDSIVFSFFLSCALFLVLQNASLWLSPDMLKVRAALREAKRIRARAEFRSWVREYLEKEELLLSEDIRRMARMFCRKCPARYIAHEYWATHGLCPAVEMLLPLKLAFNVSVAMGNLCQ